MHWLTEGQLINWANGIVAKTTAYIRLLSPVDLTIAEIIGGVLLLFIAWWIWWRLPKRQVARLPGLLEPKDRGELENNFRQTITQTVGGLVVLFGAVFAYIQFTEQHNDFVLQQQSADRKFKEQQNEFLGQQQSAHDLLVSNQVSKGFEDLGSGQIMVRIGGIYALEAVMNDAQPTNDPQQYHQAILEGLCALVREKTQGQTSPAPATDVQAALTVIGRRAVGPGVVDLEGAQLQGAVIHQNFAFADFGGANLANAHLVGVNLAGAHLGDATLTRAYLKGANLTGAQMGSANLTGADLPDANLTGAYLVETLLTAANLSHATLTGAYLGDADMTEVFLSSANLTGAQMGSANLTHAYLKDANLTGAQMGLADLVNATIDQSQLDQACGTGVKLPPGMTIKPCSKPSGPQQK